MDATQRLDSLLDDADLRDSAMAEFCRELIADQQRLHQRLERISRISAGIDLQEHERSVAWA